MTDQTKRSNDLESSGQDAAQRVIEDDVIVQQAQMIFAMVEAKLKQARKASEIPADVPRFEMW